MHIEYLQQPLETPQQIMHYLKGLGHYDNPDMPTGVTWDDLKNLTLHHKHSRTALQSFQLQMKPILEDATLNLRGKHEAVIDGDIGPATRATLDFPRCGFPDYPVPDGTLTMGREEANWPNPCRSNLRFGRLFATLPGSSKEDTDAIWWAVCNNLMWALADVKMKPTPVGDRQCDILAALERLGGSTLAYSYLARNKCPDQLAQAYNTGTNWANRDFGAAVATHEVIHALGLGHNNDRNATMFPSIHAQSIARAGYINKTDLDGLVKIGYKASSNGVNMPPRNKLYLPQPWDKPTDPDPNPDPGDPTPPSEAVHAFLMLGANDKVLRRYNIPQIKV